MRILIVTQYFWPENFRINDLVEELVNRGHEVTILTGKPNYPSGEMFPEFKASPERFSEYKGCEVIRVPITMRGQGSGRKLVTNYVSYVLAASFIGYWKLRKKQFDVSFVYEPSPVTVCLPAIFFKKMKGIPVVFWVLDLWPETLEAIGVVKSPRILSWVGKLVGFIYNRCDLVLGQSAAFYEGIVQYCDNKNKIKYFPSWSESVFLGSKNSSVNALMETDAFKVLFAGNVGEAQDFSAILSAAEAIKAQGRNIKIFVVGDGRAFDGVKQQVLEKGLTETVILLGRFPLDDMPSFYSSADALLVTLKESKAFSMTIPGKVQTYMVASKPILTMLSGEGSRIVDEAQCGLTADSGDYNQLANNMITMSALSHEKLETLGKNAKAYAGKEFDRDTLISQLESWFEEVAELSKEKQQ
ncbi:MAG: glycosyltransferase family 4 protein [Gammaproteobacteria bacterium]|nr:glycosyltransferase family 4 protein [Gammaproteobacteria bacterium]